MITLQQLKLQCRRGMLEVDLVVQRYLKDNYATADAVEQALFIKLLKENDQNLFNWFIGHAEPPAEYADLIQKMRRN